MADTATRRMMAELRVTGARMAALAQWADDGKKQLAGFQKPAATIPSR